MASAEATAGSLAREVRRIALVAVAVAVVLLAVNVGTRAHQLVSIDPTVARYRDVEEQLDAFHGALVDEETGARGYLATGDSSFLQPYRAGVAAEAAATADLGRLVDRGRQAADLVTMESRAQTWTDDWALPAASSTPPVPAGTASPAMTAFLLEGKRLFDDYRSAHDRLSADVRSDLAHAMATQRSWLLASGALEAVIAVAVVAGTLAGHRRLVRRVARPVQALSEAVSRIGAGDPDVTVEIDGPAELMTLGDDVGRMAGRIAIQTALAAEQTAEVTRHARRLQVILDAAREVAGSLNLRYVMKSVADAALRLEAHRVRIWLLDDADGRSLHCAYDTAAGAGGPATAEAAAPTSLVGRAARYGRPAGPEPSADGGGTVVAVPMIVGGAVVGALEHLVGPGVALSAADLAVVEALAGHAAGAVAAARLHERTAEQAVTDALTGLPNRRAFDTDLAAELDRAARYHRPLAMVSIDLDHFKVLNDRYGHAYGDLALQQAGTALREALRSTDRLYRIGGEELAVLCPETSAGQAGELAERLRDAVEASAGPGAPQVTASFGVACLPAHAADGAALVHAADRALYGAKEAGRNRVAVATTAA